MIVERRRERSDRVFTPGPLRGYCKWEKFYYLPRVYDPMSILSICPLLPAMIYSDTFKSKSTTLRAFHLVVPSISAGFCVVCQRLWVLAPVTSPPAAARGRGVAGAQPQTPVKGLAAPCIPTLRVLPPAAARGREIARAQSQTPVKGMPPLASLLSGASRLRGLEGEEVLGHRPRPRSRGMPPLASLPSDEA